MFRNTVIIAILLLSCMSPAKADSEPNSPAAQLSPQQAPEVTALLKLWQEAQSREAINLIRAISAENQGQRLLAQVTALQAQLDKDKAPKKEETK